MSTGFIYVIPSVGEGYMQRSFQAVPTWYRDRIYFGPCKKPMRPRMRVGDYVFGISPSGLTPRRILFAAKLAQRITFAEAFEQYPKLRGPDGPIHVRPVERGELRFPDSHYEHIPGGNHPESWRSDIQTPTLDVFFVCERAGVREGRWLGPEGPPVQGEILDFLRACKVYGHSVFGAANSIATELSPVRHGRLYTGLHLETDEPHKLRDLVCGVQRDDPMMSKASGHRQRRSARSKERKPWGRRC